MQRSVLGEFCTRHTIDLLLIAILKICFIGTALGGDKWSRRQPSYQPSYSPGTLVVGPTDPEPYTGSAKQCEDAVDEVNKARAKRGLKPYIKDSLLCQGAFACAKF